jgi:hypothetical protein
MIRISLGLFGLALAIPALAGPFGLAQGMTPAQIGVPLEALAAGHYRASSAPKAHSAFEQYLFKIGPGTGLCMVTAIGKTIDTNIQGSQLRAAFIDLSERLGASYGPARKVDRLLPGSRLRKPQDWMLALDQKQRVLAAIWDRRSGATLPPDLNSIAINAAALGTEFGYIQVEYAFANEAQCDAEIKQGEDSVL